MSHLRSVFVAAAISGLVTIPAGASAQETQAPHHDVIGESLCIDGTKETGRFSGVVSLLAFAAAVTNQSQQTESFNVIEGNMIVAPSAAGQHGYTFFKASLGEKVVSGMTNNQEEWLCQIEEGDYQRLKVQYSQQPAASAVPR